MNQIDFTNCKRILGKAYNGANGKKIAVEYKGNRYMLKFPSSGANKMTELSYVNSCYAEHIASSIFNMLGITAQETLSKKSKEIKMREEMTRSKAKRLAPKLIQVR